MIKQATGTDAAAVAALARKLWPRHSSAELETEFAAVLSSENGAVFLWVNGARPVAFAQCQLRHEYVEGTAGGPVGYLEGLFVEESERRQGIAAALLRRCEQWAASKGCAEFASDCELSNTDSEGFHLRVGFAEANRIICFTKQLSPPSNPHDRSRS